MENYANSKPWFGVGSKLTPRMSESEILRASGALWDISAVPLMAKYKGMDIVTEHHALVRSSDRKVMDVVSSSWRPVQNASVLATIMQYSNKGVMNVEAGGTFNDGRDVWFLCTTDMAVKIGRDTVRAYILVINPHRYGYAPHIRMVLINETDWGCLSVKMETPEIGPDQQSHRQSFSIDNFDVNVKAMKRTFKTYTDMMKAAQKNNDLNWVAYFSSLYGSYSGDESSLFDAPRMARTREVMVERGLTESKNGFSAYTVAQYLHSHEFGHGAKTRLSSLWMGAYSKFLERALQKALEAS